MNFDPNALALAGVTGLAAFAFAELRKPAKRQEQWMMMALAGLAAYAFRQFEGRGSQQDTQSVILAALESRFEERFKTVFNDIADIKETLSRLADKWQGAQRRGR